LHGGSQMCNNGIVYFGRLFNSWEGGGTPQTRLKDWLDPLNTQLSAISLLTGISSDTLVLAGNIKNEKENPISNTLITLYLNGNELESQWTDGSGNFSFVGLSPGAYELSMIKPDQGNNGVSTMDLIDVQKHVIQTKPFNSNIKLAAADVNKSGSVTTMDMIKIRRVILGMDCCFSNEENEWIFFLQNELIENKFPFTLNQSIFDFQMTGIKIGDVNNSASTGNG
jgi:lysyl endopeptidase